MIDIAIIELETHPEVLNLWNKILRDSAIFKVDFYINQSMKDKIHFAQESNVLFYNESEESISEFLEKNIEGKKYQLIIINTLHKRFKEYQRIVDQFKTLLVVHNLNFTFSGIQKLNFNSLINKSFNEFVFFIKIFFIENLSSFFKKNQQKITFGTLLKSPEINRELVHIPLFYTEEDSNKIEEEIIQIVIPGEISNVRKDIDLIVRVINRINPKHNITFCFLGKTKEKTLIKAFETINAQNQKIKVEYFTERVTSSIFEHKIKNAHLLLCPIKKYTNFNVIEEEYSKTKLSGNEFDCISHSKVGIFPSSYKFDYWVKFQYETEENLIQLLNQLDFEQINEKYTALNIIKNNFHLNKVKHQLEDTLQQLIQNN